VEIEAVCREKVYMKIPMQKKPKIFEVRSILLSKFSEFNGSITGMMIPLRRDMKGQLVLPLKQMRLLEVKSNLRNFKMFYLICRFGQSFRELRVQQSQPALFDH